MRDPAVERCGSPTSPALEPAAVGGTAATARRAAAGMRRAWGPGLTALICAWSGVWLALWLLAVTGVLGALLGFLGEALTGASPASPGGGVLSTAGGAIAGIAQGLVASLRALVVAEPVELLVSLAGGLALSLSLVAAEIALEPWLLLLRGWRRMSRREAARLTPLLEAAAADLGLDELPQLLIADGGSLRIRACSRHLVVGRGLLDELGDDHAGGQALTAVLCHGLHHWAGGDGVGRVFVLACGLPLALVYNAGCCLARQGNSLLALAGWAILWPAWVLVSLVIRPVSAFTSRRREYEADAAVWDAGRGAALHHALSFLGELEPGRAGWDQALAGTHPPLELRLEALERDSGR